MARVDLNRDSAPELARRLEGIRSPEQRRWGSLDPAPLLRHITFLLELSLGEREAPRVFVPVPAFVMWWLFFHWFTNWPGGKFKAPAPFFPEGEDDVEGARAECLAAMDRFVVRLETHPEQTGRSPLLGDIPLRKWARVHGVHLDHHLRQYGV